MRPFTDTLRDHRNGKLVEALTTRFADVVAAVRDTGKAGEITLKLKIVPDRSDADTFEVVPNISVKLPEKDLPRAVFYATDEGDLVREPPRGALFSQDEMEARRNERR